MLMIEACPPFQWRPKYHHFGHFRRFMWGWFAFTICPYDMNALIEGIGKAGVEVYGKRENESGK
jgi:hypothetical protein